MGCILLVDDDAQVAEALQGLLEFDGHEVAWAPDGDAAVFAVAGSAFDLVLTDLLLPDRDGLAMLLDLRRRQRNLPIIAMSGGGHAGREDLLRSARFLGADRVLAKPFRWAELQAAVGAVLAAQ